MVGVSKTAVSSIVNEAKLQDPNYALMRALVVNLEKNGSDVFQYASCVRILNLIHEYQLGANDSRRNYSSSTACIVQDKLDGSQRHRRVTKI